jgi:uncharacterized membrane protein YphA (DoxX/SURF4 family)
MTISSRVARPLLASIFVSGGLDALRNPEGKVKAAEAVTGPLTRHISALPDDTALLVRVNGGVQVVAGILLSLGKFRRISSLALIGSIVPTTLAGHRFWDEVDDEKSAQQQVHFLKNLGVLGGLILAAADTEGEPSVSWRLRRRVQRAGAGFERQKATNRGKAKRAMRNVSDASEHAWTALDKAAVKEAAKGAGIASHYLSSGAERASGLIAQAQERLSTV